MFYSSCFSDERADGMRNLTMELTSIRWTKNQPTACEGRAWHTKSRIVSFAQRSSPTAVVAIIKYEWTDRSPGPARALVYFIFTEREREESNPCAGEEEGSFKGWKGEGRVPCAVSQLAWRRDIRKLSSIKTSSPSYFASTMLRRFAADKARHLLRPLQSAASDILSSFSSSSSPFCSSSPTAAMSPSYKTPPVSIDNINPKARTSSLNSKISGSSIPLFLFWINSSIFLHLSPCALCSQSSFFFALCSLRSWNANMPFAVKSSSSLRFKLSYQFFFSLLDHPEPPLKKLHLFGFAAQRLQQELLEKPGSHPFEEVQDLHTSFFQQFLQLE